MAWLYLILAGLFEMGWPLGFKLANLCPRYHFLFLALSVVLGIVFFHDAVTFWRMFFLSLVFVGIVGLKMVH